MDKNKLMEQLRKAIREVIQEELGKSSYDAKSGISTTALTKDGKPVGYIKHKQTDKGLVAGGRIGPKAAKAVTAEEKITTNIPVAALPSYKKGEQPTVINPKTGEEEIKSDVSSWAKALEKRFGHLKRGQTASLKGDPQDVKEAEYNQDAVDKAIKTSKPKIGKKEANAIHRLLKGRHGKKSKESIEDKARAMGQMDMFTLEEWIGKLEEAGVNLNELSPETLKSYINKSARSAADLSHTAGEYDAMADDNDFSGYAWKKKAGKRLRGIRRATEKLPESYTLEEWIGKLEEAGYSLQENDPYRDRNPNPEPQPGEIPQGHGGMIGYRGIPRGPAPKPDPYRDRNPNPEPQPGEIPQGAGGYHIEERYTLEELIGMMEEAGYSVNERSVEAREKKIAKTAWQKSQGDKATWWPKKPSPEEKLAKGRHMTGPGHPSTGPRQAQLTGDKRWLSPHDRLGMKAARLDRDAGTDPKKRQQLALKGSGVLNSFRPNLPEAYTLEELIGMLEEAGYDTSEVYSLWRPKESGAKSTGVMKDPKKPKTPPAEGDARNNPSSEFSKGLAAWLRAKQKRQGGALEERNKDNKIKKKEWETEIGAKYLPYTADDIGDETGPKSNPERDARRTWVGRLNNPHK